MPSDPSADAVPPWFMFGFDRSGTTLLSMMVGAHPLLAVPFSVAGLWFRYGDRLDRYDMLSTPADVERLVDDLLEDERIGFWSAELSRNDILRSPQPKDFAGVVSSFHRAYAEKKGKPHWGNIDIATLDHMDIVNRWFPESRFLHIVRDGRDVALSHETYAYGVSNTLECAFEWRRRVESNLQMGALLGPQRYMIVRYEDLVLDTEPTLRKLCAFIGVDYSPAMLDYPRAVSDKVPEEKRWLWPTLDKNPVKSNAYRWKQNMSGAKRIVFEWNARTTLERLGYEVFERPPKRISAYLLELWYFLSRGGRLKRLRRSLGLHH